jgi:pSer/pThr/pTyr-binding forkhead associated (FHA) protein
MNLAKEPGQNGSRAPVDVPKPEVAGAAINRQPMGSATDKPHAKLVIERGKSSGKEFPLSLPESHIGRWDADGGVFPDVDLDSDDPEAKVSRRHARISFVDGKYFLEDLGSTNGTFVNRGKRLAPGSRQPLGDGDEIIVGKTFLRFHVIK